MPVSLPDALPPDDGHRLPFPTVALGASAGGVEALQRLFAATPPDMGCAFVVVMHLAPDVRSQLVPLLERTTSMPVHGVEADIALEPDHVYVITPGRALEIHGGVLKAPALGGRLERPLPVDRFMISLAVDQREHAVGVVLTGTDGDGAIGTKAIKGEGGFTIAQLPTSAAHAGMPRSAVATGQVDRQLTIEEIPPAIAGFITGAGLVAAAPPTADPNDLAAVLELLRRQTGMDFSGYKRPMLQRRVYRRMGLTRTRSLAAYGELLQQSTAEAAALAADFLISVTEFFREPEAWDILAEDVLPQLLQGKQATESVRVWVPACASGEEAYSVAMLLLEQPQVADRRLKVQVFATDVDAAALDVARKGRYARTIESSVRPERRQRFFALADGMYQVRKELRDVVTFAPQNVLSDPPFSRMDMVSCRNLLIYLEPELQRRALQVFHYALVADGVLALGKSETVGPLGESFHTLSQSARIYRRIGAAPGPASLPLQRKAWGIPNAREPRDLSHPLALRLDYGQTVREALLEQGPSMAVLIDRDGNVLYYYGPVRRYLDVPEGTPTADLFAMVDAALRPHLRAGIHRALQSGSAVAASPPVTLDTERGSVRITVGPLPHPTADDLLLVTFEEVDEPAARAQPRADDDLEAALHALEEELRGTKRELRTAIEQLESANEELKVANEEAMSTNEELQSTNEELETSQEELQSVNEELSAVNHQLQSKVLELEKTNDDLNNLLASTSIPTLFLDRQLRINRFTPALTRLYNLIASDLQRPLADLAGYDDTRAVIRDAEQVLETLMPVERETRTSNGSHYLRRTFPYRTQDDRIDGVVITFIDITELKRATESLRRYAAVMRDSTDAVVVHAPDGRILAWNHGAERMYGYSADEALAIRVGDLVPDDVRMPHAELVQRALGGAPMQVIEQRRRRRDGTELEVASSLSVIRGDSGQPEALSMIERDVTPRKRAQAQLLASEQRFRTLADTAPVLIWLGGADGTLLFANQEFVAFVGEPADQILRHPLAHWLAGDAKAQLLAALAALLPGQRHQGKVCFRHRDGKPRWMICSLIRQADAPAASAIVGCLVDVDAQVRAEENVREADRRKDEFLAMLGHELRNPLAPIRNAAEVLKRVGVADERVRWVQGVLVRQVDHMTRLVDDLLDISRMTRGTLRLRVEPLDLRDVLRRAIETAAPLVNEKRQSLQTALGDEPAWVEGDTVRLLQVFGNLLSNAIKYTAAGGRIDVALRNEADTVAVSVADNGTGLSEEMRSRVFDLFVQDPRTIDRSQGGLGIGLALVKHLVAVHGGTVEARSGGLGQGSQFEIRLPRLKTTPRPAEPAAPGASTSNTGRILVIDDDMEGLESLRMVLELAGFEVRGARDLDAAMRAFDELRPHVVVTDIAMPGADGYEVARHLRAKAASAGRVAFVAMSGYGRPGDLERSSTEGFDHHFVKPIEPAELESLLRELVLRAGD